MQLEQQEKTLLNIENYDNQFDISSEIIKYYTLAIHKKLEAIDLNKELGKDKTIHEKKIKL